MWGLLPFFLMLYLQVGCAGAQRHYVKDTTQERDYNAFQEAQAQNTHEAYKLYLSTATRSTKFTDEARKALSESDENAFLRSCNIGTPMAWNGFLTDHPSSEYSALVRDRIEYLLATRSQLVDDFERFILQHPHSPFLPEAISSVPVLWIRHAFTKTTSARLAILQLPAAVSAQCTNEMSDFQQALRDKDIGYVMADSDAARVCPLVAIFNSREVLEYLAGGKTKAKREDIIRNMVLSGLVGLLLLPPDDPRQTHSESRTVCSIRILNPGSNVQYYSDVQSVTEVVSLTEAVSASAAFGNDAVPSLMFAMCSASPDVRRLAATVLGKLNDGRTVDILTRALDDFSPFVREAVAAALGRVGDSRIAERLHSALRTEEVWFVRTALQEAIAGLSQ